MPILDIFSKRQKRLRGEMPDVYQYDTLPDGLRTQVVWILKRAFGGECSRQRFHVLHQCVAEEYGLLELPGHGLDPDERVCNFVLSASTPIEKVFDVIEVVLGIVPLEFGGFHDPSPWELRQRSSAAVEELNTRFKEHAVGYEIHEGRVVRVDSAFLHQETVKPALSVLQEPQFAGAEQEFRNAHEHYRSKRYEEAITESLKALESTLKVICGRRGWPFKAEATAKELIGIVFKEGLVPAYLQSKFTALRSVLESGVPTVRNRSGGHGAGATPRQVPTHLAGYVLHLTAAAVVFLAECEKQLP